MNKNRIFSNKTVVLFDVDKTLFDDQTQKLFIKFLYKKGKISLYKYTKLLFTFLLYKLHLLPFVNNIREKAFEITKGWNVKEIEELSREFFNKILISHFINRSKEEILKHKKRGNIVILFSTSWNIIIKPVKEYLNTDYQISTEIESKQNIFTGKIKSRAVYGIDKVKIINKFLKNNNLDKNKIIAYADHISDFNLLKFVDIPVAVNPDYKLRKIAKKNNWLIYNWK